MRLEYIGDPDRVFPTLGIAPEKGEVFELPFEPDGVLWREAGTAESGDEPGRTEGLTLANVSEPAEPPADENPAPEVQE